MTILEIVRNKVKNDAITDTDLTIAIDEVQVSILNYCNIDEVPDSLVYTWANMAADLSKYQYESTVTGDGVLDEFDASDVSAIKIGDTNISLAGGSSTNSRNKVLKSHTPNLDDIVMNYREQLNKFRRMI